MSNIRPASRMMSRVGTAQREVTFSGVGLNTKVSVSAQPVKGEGLSGSQTRGKTAGPKRQIQDPTFYLGLLREKNAELLAEIDKFKKEKTDFEADSKLFTQFERRYEILIKEVREFEGQLADLNLAHDKHRSGTNPLEIMRFQKHVREHNEAQAKDVDQVFIQRQQREAATKDILDQIKGLEAKTQAKIATLDEEKAARYATQHEVLINLKERARKGLAQIEQMKVQIRSLEDEIQNNTFRNEFADRNKKFNRLKKETGNLEMDLESMLMDPAEARQKLLAKVKNTNQEVKELKLQCEVVIKENDSLRSNLEGLTRDIEDRKGDGADNSKKYEVLFKRDKEMTDFIDKFPEEKKKEEESQAASQNMIVALLSHISTDLSRQHNLPSEAKVTAMREDLSFKKRQVDASETTHQRLQQELQKRQIELEKINGLDKKITVELKSLAEKMNFMSMELPELKDVDGLKSRARETNTMLKGLRQQYIQRANAAQQQNAPLSTKYEKVKSALAKHAIDKAMKKAEKNMRRHQMAIFSKEEFIERKGAETDYDTLRHACLRLIDDINRVHVNRVSSAAV